MPIYTGKQMEIRKVQLAGDDGFSMLSLLPGPDPTAMHVADAESALAGFGGIAECRSSCGKAIGEPGRRGAGDLSMGLQIPRDFCHATRV
jgi:hypothetical protein